MAILKANTGIGLTNPTSALTVAGDGLFTGIITAKQFYGPVLYAVSAGIATYATSAGLATYATSSGISSTLTFNASVNTIGIITASSFVGSGANLTGLNASNLSSGTVPGARITASGGNFTVGQDLFVNGNVTIGGTSNILNTITAVVKDRDIVLGVTTNASNADISTDNTANHGGVAVASTEGTPILNIPTQTGINSLPSTYKQIMWIKSGNYSGLGTDAWVFNYGVSIGNTSTVLNGSRLTVGTGFTVFDGYLDATDIRARNINATGIVTAINGFVGNVTGTATTATNLANGANITTGTINSARLSGTYNIGITGNASTADYAVLAGIATYASSSGIATYASSSGIATHASSAGIATYAQSSGISTDVIGGIGSLTQLQVTGISTLGIITSADIYSVGVVTAVSFYGDGSNLTGLVNTQYAALSGVSTNVIGGIGSLTQLQVTGISTFTNGPVFIGTATSTGTATQRLQVTGGAYVSSSLGVGITNPSQALQVGGNILASGTVTANSDEKIKKNIKTIDNALEKVLSLRGVEYDRTDIEEHQIGVIAQEVEKIIPEVVYGDEVKSVAYGNLIGLLIEAIKEQNQRIEVLENKLRG